MKPICVKCHRFYRPKKTGYIFIEGMPKENDTPPGLVEPENWEPYKLWSGDLWRCPTCLTEIIVGTGNGPIREHYEPDFKETVERFQPELQVNDC